MTVDWRLPEHRREAFLRFYGFHLRYRAHPGSVYSLLPAIAEAYDLDDAGRAWLAWLNGNTQNPVTSLLLLEASDLGRDPEGAVDLWELCYAELQWDTDRRHQKSRFGEATHGYLARRAVRGPALDEWLAAGAAGWKETWKFAMSLPYMGRLSAWSMIEFARILLGGDRIPDADDFLLGDRSGSRSHRNGLGVISGREAAYWKAAVPFDLGVVDELDELAEDLLLEAELRFPDEPDVSRLSMESALCTYKSWHKPGRRYPNVYSDLTYSRIRRGEANFGERFGVLWEARRRDLPENLRLEDNPNDPGAVPVKQNHYLRTGEVIMMERDYPDMENGFAAAVARGDFGRRAS